MYRNQVAASSGIGWRIAAELSGDIKRNTHSDIFVLEKDIKHLKTPSGSPVAESAVAPVAPVKKTTAEAKVEKAVEKKAKKQ
jgi:hypothetical protein